MSIELAPDDELRHDILDALDASDELIGGFGVSVSAGVVTLCIDRLQVTDDDIVVAVDVVRLVPGVFAINHAFIHQDLSA